MARERAQEEAALTQLSDETERLGRQLEDHRLCMIRVPMEARKNYRDIPSLCCRDRKRL